MVLIRGEPGIGKSRLLWELRQGAPAVLWLDSRCQPRFQNTALYPLIALLEQLLGFRTEDGLDVRRDNLARTLARYGLDRASAPWLLSLLLGLPTGAPAPQTIIPAQREQMRELFLALLSARAAEQPFVLAIEDLHWSDPSTVDWLGHSIASLAAAPCLGAARTARPAFDPAWLALDDARAHVVTLTLGPLRAEQAAQMVRGLAGRTYAARADTASHHRPGGASPFIEELTKTVLERPDPPGKAAATEVPATLLDSLVERLDRLGAAKETAQWAAAIGREFSYPLLCACAPYEQDRVQGDLARLIEAELVSPVAATPQDIGPYLEAQADSVTAPLRYAFKHTLMQEAAYVSLLKRTRQAHHRRIAETLEGRFPRVAELRPEILAQHYANAGLNDRAIDYYVLAGERATAQGATRKQEDSLTWPWRRSSRATTIAAGELSRGASMRSGLPESESRSERISMRCWSYQKAWAMMRSGRRLRSLARSMLRHSRTIVSSLMLQKQPLRRPLAPGRRPSRWRRLPARSQP